jgi:hypothetical protein
MDAKLLVDRRSAGRSDVEELSGTAAGILLLPGKGGVSSLSAAP